MEQICHTEILGLGAFLPEKVVTSNELQQAANTERFGIPFNFIERKIGIIERRVASGDVNPSDLAIRSAHIAIEDARITPKDIDLVIYCGIDRDLCEPATAHLIAGEVGITANCFDVSNACHGFINGISIADALIANGNANIALIVTGEKPSRVMYDAIDLINACKDSSAFKKMIGALTVGDAGAAMLIGRRKSKKRGFLKFNFHDDSKLARLCYYSYRKGTVEGQMLMKPISMALIRLNKQLISKAYRMLKWEPGEVDCLICHQVGIEPHQSMAAIAGIDYDKATKTVANYGNLTSATIPVNLFLNRPAPGDKVLLMGAGSGLSISHGGLIF